MDDLVKTAMRMPTVTIQMSTDQAEWFTVHIYLILTAAQPGRSHRGLFHFLLLNYKNKIKQFKPS